MSHEVVRDLPAGVLTEIEIDFTRPVFLVKMLFPAATRYVSTGPQITFDTNIYIEGQVTVKTFQWTSDGVQTGTIVLSNEANSASALILGSTINDVEVEIYKTYLIAGGGNTAPQLYVRGVMDGATIGPSDSKITVVSTTARAAFLPNRYHTAAEGFNWLPVDGEVISWGSEVFLMQSRI
jgi:hypothetical protein